VNAAVRMGAHQWARKRPKPVAPAASRMMIAAAKEELVSSHRHCDLMLLALDAAEDGACVTDRTGARLYTSGPLERMLVQDPDRDALDRSIDDLGRALWARPAQETSTLHLVRPRVNAPASAGRAALTLQVRTSTMEYHLHATLMVRTKRGAGEELCVIWVCRRTPRLFTAPHLRELYGLTPREVRVAMLLVARLRSREVAQVLGISVHTARRHSESVLRKVGVRSRAELQDRLRAGS